MCDVFYSLRHLAAKRFPSKCSFLESNNTFGNDVANEMLFFCSYLTGTVKIFAFSQKASEFLTLPIRYLVFGSDCMLW